MYHKEFSLNTYIKSLYILVRCHPKILYVLRFETIGKTVHVSEFNNLSLIQGDWKIVHKSRRMFSHLIKLQNLYLKINKFLLEEYLKYKKRFLVEKNIIRLIYYMSKLIPGFIFVNINYYYIRSKFATQIAVLLKNNNLIQLFLEHTAWVT